MLFGETNGRGKRCAQNLSNRFKSYNSCKYIIGCHRNLRYVHTSYALFCLSGNQKSPKRLIVSEIFQIFAGESEWEEPRGLLIQKHAVPARHEKNICRAQKKSLILLPRMDIFRNFAFGWRLLRQSTSKTLWVRVASATIVIKFWKPRKFLKTAARPNVHMTGCRTLML